MLEASQNKIKVPLPSIIDCSTLELAKTGSPKAMDLLLTASYSLGYRVAFKGLAHPQDAEDIGQRTSLKVYINFGKFTLMPPHPERGFSFWVYRIAERETVNELRDRARVSRGYSATRYSIGGEDDLMPDIPDLTADDPLGTNLDREARVVVADALRRLPVHHREIARLAIMEGWSYDEIATQLDIKHGTVGSRLSRLKERLKGDEALADYLLLLF